MSVYRVYWVGADDHFKLAQDVECATDAEVLAKAEALIGQYAAMEVWDMRRFVGRVGASRRPVEQVDLSQCRTRRTAGICR